MWLTKIIILTEDTSPQISILFFFRILRKHLALWLDSFRMALTMLPKKYLDPGALDFAAKQLPSVVHSPFALKW